MILALTGGIGCGKSTVSNFFSDLGWKLLDADKICHELYETKADELKQTFESRWGVGAVSDSNSAINRNKIAEIVFSDQCELEWLNSVFHPMILDSAKSQMGDYDVIFDIPLLYEVGWQNDFDCVIAVWSNRAIQHDRLRKRGWSDEEITSRIESQLESDIKLEKSDFGLINSSSFENLKNQCIKLDKILRTN